MLSGRESLFIFALLIVAILASGEACKVGGTSTIKTLSESVGEPAVHRLRTLRAASTCRAARSRSKK
jgi:hypothetical protein